MWSACLVVACMVLVRMLQLCTPVTDKACAVCVECMFSCSMHGSCKNATAVYASN